MNAPTPLDRRNRHGGAGRPAIASQGFGRRRPHRGGRRPERVDRADVTPAHRPGSRRSSTPLRDPWRSLLGQPGETRNSQVAMSRSEAVSAPARLSARRPPRIAAWLHREGGRSGLVPPAPTGASRREHPLARSASLASSALPCLSTPADLDGTERSTQMADTRPPRL
jgi:hypothetical protein